MTLHDKFGRQITDLRISITDRCNFRCVYCRSADPENYRDHDEILSWPELDRLARVFLHLGIRKIRITGGEPLVRDGVEDYIARLHSLGVEDLSMTTNGHLLAERCDRLIAAGLPRINISLDSLDPARFESITRTKSFTKVMDGIEAAQKSRLAPAKVNAVLVRGVNDDEVESFASRFPPGCPGPWQALVWLPWPPGRRPRRQADSPSQGGARSTRSRRAPLTLAGRRYARRYAAQSGVVRSRYSRSAPGDRMRPRSYTAIQRTRRARTPATTGLVRLGA